MKIYANKRSPVKKQNIFPLKKTVENTFKTVVDLYKSQILKLKIQKNVKQKRCSIFRIFFKFKVNKMQKTCIFGNRKLIIIVFFAIFSL